MLYRAKRFFAERVPLNAAYPEKEGPELCRPCGGRAGRRLRWPCAPDPRGTRVRASTLLFDQVVDRFLSTLPPAGRARRMSGALPMRVMVQDAWDEVFLELPGSTPLGGAQAPGARAHPCDAEPFGLPAQVPRRGVRGRIPLHGRGRPGAERGADRSFPAASAGAVAGSCGFLGR